MWGHTVITRLLAITFLSIYLPPAIREVAQVDSIHTGHVSAGTVQTSGRLDVACSVSC